VALAHWVTSEGRAGLEALVAALRASPERAAFLAEVIRSVLRETHCRTLFAETGLPRQFRFFAELGSRVVRGVLPDPPDDDDLAELIERLFPSRSDAEFLSALPLALVEDLLTTLFPNGEEPFAPVREEMADALRILSVWASGLGLSADFRLRAGNRANPIASGAIFLRLPESVGAAAHMSRAKGSLAGERRAVKLAALADVEACRAVIVEVRRHLEEFGVSADLVFRIWTLEKLLERLGRSSTSSSPDGGANVTRTGVALLDARARRGEDRSVRDLLHTSSQLLARKVIGGSANRPSTTSRRRAPNTSRCFARQPGAASSPPARPCSRSSSRASSCRSFRRGSSRRSTTPAASSPCSSRASRSPRSRAR
jgi:site-specific recombinase